MVGDLTLTVVCQADAPSFDLCAVLSVVRAHGIFNFSQGYRRVSQKTDQFGTVRLALQPTCMSIAAGESLRLSISAACFPAFAVNPGTGENPNQAKVSTHSIITVQIQLGLSTRLILPGT